MESVDSENVNASSVRKMPPGKLQDIRKLFETSGDGAPGKKISSELSPNAIRNRKLSAEMSVSPPTSSVFSNMGIGKQNVMQDEIRFPKAVGAKEPIMKTYNNLETNRLRDGNTEWTMHNKSDQTNTNSVKPVEKLKQKSDALVNRFDPSNAYKDKKFDGDVQMREKVSGPFGAPIALPRRGVKSALIINEADRKKPSVLNKTKLFERSISENISPKPAIRQKPKVILLPPSNVLPRSPNSDRRNNENVIQNATNRETIPKISDPETLSPRSSNMVKIPKPPLKPPRTHEHTEYMKLKGVSTSTSPPAVNETHNIADEAPNTTGTLQATKGKIGKPARPPPPRPQGPRPLTIATDTVDVLSNASKGKGTLQPAKVRLNEAPSLPMTNPSYEDVIPINIVRKKVPKAESTLMAGSTRTSYDSSTMRVKRPIKRYPLRKTISDECLYAESSISKVPIYMDPTAAARGYQEDDDDDLEAYIDMEGYAVPYRFVKRPLDRHSSHDPTLERHGHQKGGGIKAKLEEIRRMLLEPRSPKHGPLETQKPTKRRLQVVKQKVNQAFEVLRRYVLRPSDDATQEEGADNMSVDSDSIIDDSEIQRRVDYVSSVKVKTCASVKQSRRLLETIYPQLFEYALIIGLEYVESLHQYQPHVIHKFPEIVDSNVSIPKFCFPDASEFQPSPPGTSESYSFVLTNFDGGRVYGYCRRLTTLDTGNAEVICIISPVDAFCMYNTLLDEIEKRRLITLEFAKELIAAAFGRPLPSPGKSVQVKALTEEAEMQTIMLLRPADNRSEGINYECLLTTLGVTKLLQVFSSIMMERSVLFCASNLSTLSSTIHAVSSLLYPFAWQHTYIPVLPFEMIEVCCSPTPYIIGILSSHLALVQSLPIDEVLIVDLDRKKLLSTVGDETTILPHKLQKALKTAINMCKVDTDAELSKNLMISEAFIRLFVEVIGHFGEHIRTQQDGKKVFLRDSFVKNAQCKSMSQLLQWFLETQMFEVFINNQMDRPFSGTAGLFLTRIMEYREEEEAGPSRRKEFGKKVRNFGRALKTKLVY